MTSAPSCDLLLTGGIVVTIDDDRRVFDPGAVAISGDRIVAVGSSAELATFRAARVVDCRGRAVMPGLVNCHNHLFHVLARGLGEGAPLFRWLSEFLWPYAAAMDADDARIAAIVGAVEAARSGITAILDHHYAPPDLPATLGVATAIEAVGLRGVVARGMFGPPTPVSRRLGLPDTFFRYGLEEDIEITRACIEARPPGTMISVWPAPNNVVYARQDLVRGAARLARELGTKWHGHCSEARSDPDRYVEEHGVRPVAWLEREGLLGPEATIAHGIWLDDAEMEALGRNQVGVAYTPLSHQFLSMGVIRLRDLRRAGAVVGLGTDGAVCNNRQDMFEVMKQSILLQRVATLDPTVSSGEEALELATREGARYLGIEAGVLAPGKLADLAVVDLGGAHLRPLHRVVAALAYSARGSDVAMTIVGGRVVYEDGACTLVQEAEVLAEAQARAEDLVERAGMQGLRAPWRRVEVSGAALAGR